MRIRAMNGAEMKNKIAQSSPFAKFVAREKDPDELSTSADPSSADQRRLRVLTSPLFHSHFDGRNGGASSPRGLRQPRVRVAPGACSHFSRKRISKYSTIEHFSASNRKVICIIPFSISKWNFVESHSGKCRNAVCLQLANEMPLIADILSKTFDRHCCHTNNSLALKCVHRRTFR